MEHWLWLSPMWLWLLLPLGLWWWFAPFVPMALPSMRLRHAFIDRWLVKRSMVQREYSPSVRYYWGGIGVCIVFALAQPVWQQPGKVEEVPLTQANGQVVIEASVSLGLCEATGESRLQQAQHFIQQLAQARSSQARTGLVVFADEVYPVLEPTQDMAQVVSLVDRLDAALAGREDSALLEAVQFAAWQLQTNGQLPAWLLLITDGAHSHSRGSLAQVMSWLQQMGIQVEVLLLGADISASSSDKAETAAPLQSAAGLLYMPRQDDLAQQLTAWHVQTTRVEDSTQVDALIHRLTQALDGQQTRQSVEMDQQALSPWLLMMALMLSLLMWWREIRYAVG